MDIGICAAQHGRLADPAAVRALASAAEQLGYSSVWADAVPPGAGHGSLDAVAVLSMTASVTTRVRIGLRLDGSGGGPAAVGIAGIVESLHRLSEGRLVVGIGVDAAGGPDGLGDLLDRRPSGHRRPLVLLAAPDLTPFEDLVPRADGWHATGVPVDVLGARWRSQQDLVATGGGEPGAMRLVVPVDVALSDVPAVGGDRRPYTGTVDEVADDLEVARRAGAHEVVLRVGGDPSVDDVLDVDARVAEALDDRTGGSASPRR